ncbi:MAG: hypothetical protein JSW61_02185, partial [Candidatus Thorarchaeota archaeon]
RAESNAVIAGVVLDESNNPICDAVVEALMFSSVSDIWFRTSTSTDCSGRFEMIVDREGAYRVYALCDRPETDGIDYVPAVWHTNVAFGSISYFSFVLMEGASLYLGEDLWFAESNKPADYYRFTVIDFEVPSNVRNPVTIYGTDSIQVGILGFEERVIIVPADREVGIRVYARNNDVVRQFRVKGAAGYFKLSKGEVLQVDIREHSLPFDIEKMRTLWRSAFSLLQDSEEAGFLVSLEREDLTNAYSLTEEAYFHLVARAYDTSFAKIRNAHVLISVTTERLQGLLETSSQSALLVLLFLVFMSSASAYLITERSDRLEISSIGRTFSLSVNLLIALAIYSLLVMAFYFLFPGCHLVPQNVFAIASVLSIVLGQIIVIIFPRVFSEKESEGRSIQLRSAIISAFSMACRNLRRRKIRTLLGLMNISILVFGFITFTSLSIGYGLVVQQLGPSNTAEGLLIRDEPSDPGHPSSFIPLPASFIRWLESQPNTSLISRKAQTTMASGENPIGYLYSKSGARMPIWGILGIIPVAEAQLVSLDSIVTEGEYLEDDDFYGILISQSFKDRLEVD